jgi:pimeloyl-ACP methyl ester carboxylesterase
MENLGSYVYKQASEFYKTIKQPYYFFLFNLFVVIQAVPAITYYVLFFGHNFYILNSTGMPAVWGATIGSFSATTVTMALVPAPPGVITLPLCWAIVLWQFWNCFMLIGCAFCLGCVHDYHGMAWCILGGIIAGAGAYFFVYIYEKEKPKYDEVPDNTNTIVVGDQSGLDASSIELALPEKKDDIDNSKVDSNDDKKTKSEATIPPNYIFIPVQMLVWTVVLVFYVIPAAFLVQQIWYASEYYQYKMPGNQYNIKAVGNQGVKIPMHIYCTGTSMPTYPTIVIEADFGMSGFAYYSLQDSMAALGWRTCIYDRPGYGWSNMSPLGSGSPANYARRLHDLLTEADEVSSNNLLLVGHGTGAELAQIFAYEYPANVAGIAIVDGYSNIYALDDKSNYDIALLYANICGDIHISRTMENCGFLRSQTDILLESYDYSPSDEKDRFLSTMNNNKYYGAQYGELCTTKEHKDKDPTRYTDYLSRHGTVGMVASTYTNQVIRWPQLAANIPALIVSAEKTLNGDVIVYDGNEVEIYKASLGKKITEQALSYNTTLSPTSTSQWIVCDSCDHYFPYGSHAGWLADELDSYFKGFF